MPKLRRDRLRGCRGCDFRTEGNEDNEESAWIELNKTAAAVATALWAVFVMLKDRRNRTATGRWLQHFWDRFRSGEREPFSLLPSSSREIPSRTQC